MQAQLQPHTLGQLVPAAKTSCHGTTTGHAPTLSEAIFRFMATRAICITRAPAAIKYQALTHLAENLPRRISLDIRRQARAQATHCLRLAQEQISTDNPPSLPTRTQLKAENPNIPHPSTWHLDRENLIVRMREQEGMLYRQIARTLDLTGPGEVRRIYARACRRRRDLQRKHQPNPARRAAEAQEAFNQ